MAEVVNPNRPARSLLPVPPPNPWIIAMTVTLATFMEVLDTSIANVALPHIAGDLGATQNESTWVLTSYLVSNAIILPISGWLSNRIGRKRFYMTCVLLFTLSSMLCGLATSLPLLILFRVMQGFGGGGLGPSEQAILADTFSPEQRQMGFAIYGMAVVVAPAIGPTLGGWITDNFSWHWIFFINVPIGILSLFLTQRLVHDPPYVIAAKNKKVSTDYTGIAAIAIGIGLLQYVLDKGEELDWFDSRAITLCTIVAVVSLLFMLWREWHHPEPIIQLQLLKNRNLASATLFNFILGIVLNGSSILLPQFLQYQLGYTSEQAGMALSPGGIALGLLMPVAGFLAMKFDPRKLIATGFFITSAAMFYMMQISTSIDFHTVVMMRILQMAGLPLIFIPISTLSYVGLRREDNNQVSGISNFVRNLGGAVGTSFLISYLSRHQQISRNDLVSHLHAGNYFYQRLFSGIQHSLILKGAAPTAASHAALAQLDRLVSLQAQSLAFVSSYFLLGVVLLCLIPLAFIMKRPKPSESDQEHAMH